MIFFLLKMLIILFASLYFSYINYHKYYMMVFVLSTTKMKKENDITKIKLFTNILF